METVRTQKIRKPVILIIWGAFIAITAILVLLSFVHPNIGYIEYKAGQEYAIECCEKAGMSYNGNVKDLYDEFNPTYTRVRVNGVTYTNSDVVDSARKMDRALYALMSEKGFHGGSSYLQYDGYFDFANGTDAGLYAFGCPLCLFIISVVLTVIVAIERKKQLIIEGESLTYKALAKKRHFNSVDLVSVQDVGKNGIKVVGNRIKFTIRHLSNRDEVKNTLLSLINNFRAAAFPSHPVTTPAPDTSVDFKSLEKLKDLLDQGIITQEEFDAKKKQLLGL